MNVEVGVCTAAENVGGFRLYGHRLHHRPRDQLDRDLPFFGVLWMPLLPATNREHWLLLQSKSFSAGQTFELLEPQKRFGERTLPGASLELVETLGIHNSSVAAATLLSQMEVVA